MGEETGGDREDCALGLGWPCGLEVEEEFFSFMDGRSVATEPSGELIDTSLVCPTSQSSYMDPAGVVVSLLACLPCCTTSILPPIFSSASLSAVWKLAIDFD